MSSANGGKTKQLTFTGLQSTRRTVYKMPWLKTAFGERAFSHADSAVWNGLPASTKGSTNSESFCRRLKTHFINPVFA